MSVSGNKWLMESCPSANNFEVDRTKVEYYIQYYQTKKLVSDLNQDWINVLNNLNALKTSIEDINKSIDSEDYKAQTIDVINAIVASEKALDSNFKQLFSSVVKRMEESAESDEWFAETAALYASYILNGILGGKMIGQANATSTSSPSSMNTIENAPAEGLSTNNIQYNSNSQNNSSTSGGGSGNNYSSSSGNSGGSADNYPSSSQSSSVAQSDFVINHSQEISPQAVAGEGRVIDIPNSVRQTGLCPNYTNYDRFYGKWNKGTMQRELSEQWGAAGKPSSNGIATLNGRYLVAVSTKFGKVGDNIDIVLNDGQVINATIADSKGKDATSEWGHVLTKKGAVDIIEWEATVPQSEINLGSWRNVGVDKIINLTN